MNAFNAWETVAVVLLLAVSSWTDIRSMRIPNEVTATFAAGGVLYEVAAYGMTGLFESAAGLAAGLLPLLVLYRFGGVGGGDVKWFGAFGAWAGASLTLQMFFFSVLFAGAFSAALLLFRMPALRGYGSRVHWPWGPHPVTSGRGAKFPFMLAAIPGLIMLLGKG